MGFKKAIISTVAAAAMATASFAATEVAQNQKGNYLVFPAYYGVGEWSTNVRLVNTNETDAVVMKVVVRRYADSKEVLDFLVFLSPGDVWTADIVPSGDGAKIVSTDDSMFLKLLTGRQQVGPDNPIDQDFFTGGVEHGSGNSSIAEAAEGFGYVEAYVLAQKPGVEIDPNWTPKHPLSKTAIFDSFSVDGKIDGRDPAQGGIQNDPADNNWTAGDDNSVYGQALVTAKSSSGANRSMTLMATALKGALVKADGTPAMAHNDAPIAVDTGVATDLEINPVTFRDNVTNALLKNNVYVTFYENSEETKLLFTQPTQHLYNKAFTNPYWNVDTAGNWALFYSNTGRNNSEFTPIPTPPELTDLDFSGPTLPDQPDPVYTYCKTEICQFSFLGDAGMHDFESGYIRVDLQGRNPLDASNSVAPGIPTVMTGVTVNGTQIVNMYKPAFD